jgi:uncharacterized protein YeaO (DUF488 family)
MITTKRVYDIQGQAEGKIFLVDRIWPRGIKKSDLKIDGWIKEAAPSSQLRVWYHHEPDRWEEFKNVYYEQLDSKPGAWQPILEAARDGDVTLLYSSKESHYNNAVALKTYLEEKLSKSG